MSAYRTATRYTLLALARNRLAVIILITQLPLLISLAYVIGAREVVGFRHRASGELLHGGGKQINMLSCALLSVALLVGFATFTAARRSAAFDKRLVAAGLPRAAILLAKITSLTIAATLVSAYATAWLLWYWPTMQQPALMFAGILAAALLYGALGLFLALFLPGELEGMFTIIMASLIDLSLQNPAVNPAADAEIITVLPSYGAMQTCLAAGFTHVIPLSQLALSVTWTAGFTVTALAVFALGTRSYTTTTDTACEPNPQPG